MMVLIVVKAKIQLEALYLPLVFMKIVVADDLYILCGGILGNVTYDHNE